MNDSGSGEVSLQSGGRTALKTLKTGALVVLLGASTAALAYYLGGKTGSLIADRRTEQALREKRTSDTAALLALSQNLAIGKRLPDHRFQTLSGDSVNLLDLLRKKTVVAIISAGCQACLGQVGDVLAASGDGRDVESFVFVASGDVDRLTTLRDGAGLRSPVLLDAEAEFQRRLFAVGVYPTNIIVDREGVVEDIVVGRLTESEIRGVMESNRGE